MGECPITVHTSVLRLNLTYSCSLQHFGNKLISVVGVHVCVCVRVCAMGGGGLVRSRVGIEAVLGLNTDTLEHR